MREGKFIEPKRGKHKKMVRRPDYMPDYFADSIVDVDFAVLKAKGIKHILIDLDLTLKRKLQWHLEKEIVAYLKEAKQQHGFESISIATNNMLNITRYAKVLSANIFQPFWKGYWIVRKPNRLYFERIFKFLDAKPKECVIIGDKLKSDIYGGNMNGMLTVLVKAKGQDYWYDLVLFTRLRENRVLSKYLNKSSW